eukprot:snap_masked-scaffold_4-processed-gene-8.36-mRNA-1 protein AED:1.00 eAED:1.00 QI:0/0/0/0/1/1/3/0/124
MTETERYWNYFLSEFSSAGTLSEKHHALDKLYPVCRAISFDILLSKALPWLISFTEPFGKDDLSEKENPEEMNRNQQDYFSSPDLIYECIPSIYSISGLLKEKKLLAVEIFFKFLLFLSHFMLE